MDTVLLSAIFPISRIEDEFSFVLSRENAAALTEAFFLG